MFQNALLVGLGGFLGSILRYLTGQLFSRYSQIIPWGTFAVNILGSFFIGLILAFLEKNYEISSGWKLFLAVGFCGGFTTFSSFAYENLSFFQQNNILTSIIYISASIILGILAVFLGFFIMK